MSGKEIENPVLRTALIGLVLTLGPPVVAGWAIFRLLRGGWLRTRFLWKWRRQGARILFVHSDSPNWQDHIDREIRPKLEPHAVFLNFSKRAEWKSSRPLEARVWAHWAGEREYNPMAIVFPPRGRTRLVRFYQPFRDFKHGNYRLLLEKEKELFDLVSRLEESR